MSLTEFLLDTINLRTSLVQKQFDDTQIEQILDAIAESSLIVTRVDGD